MTMFMRLHDNPAALEVHGRRGREMRSQKRQDARAAAADQNDADQPTEDDFNPDETDTDTDDDLEVEDMSRLH
jgi:hypothetical protein